MFVLLYAVVILLPVMANESFSCDSTARVAQKVSHYTRLLKNHL